MAMITFIQQSNGTILVDICKPKKGFTCGMIDEEGRFRIFKRYFDELQTPTFSPEELYLIAQKGEEMARAFMERQMEEEIQEDPDPWRKFFLGEE